MELNGDLLLRAYAVGIFPMAESAESDELYWFDPEMRGILPLDSFHIPRRLRRTLRQGLFDVRINTAFQRVIEACAEAAPNRPETWINQTILQLYCELHERGFAHSVEVWEKNTLVGGLYGVALGGVFFGESMFSRTSDASKVALVHLIARLRVTGFTLLDTQFVTRHLSQFGAVEIPREQYRRELAQALAVQTNFAGPDEQAVLETLIAADQSNRLSGTGSS